MPEQQKAPEAPKRRRVRVTDKPKVSTSLRELEKQMTKQSQVMLEDALQNFDSTSFIGENVRGRHMGASMFTRILSKFPGISRPGLIEVMISPHPVIKGQKPGVQYLDARTKATQDAYGDMGGISRFIVKNALELEDVFCHVLPKLAGRCFSTKEQVSDFLKTWGYKGVSGPKGMLPPSATGYQVTQKTKELAAPFLAWFKQKHGDFAYVPPIKAPRSAEGDTEKGKRQYPFESSEAFKVSRKTGKGEVITYRKLKFTLGRSDYDEMVTREGSQPITFELNTENHPALKGKGLVLTVTVTKAKPVKAVPKADKAS